MTVAPGLFITFEGGEGAGKSTLMERLKIELQKRGHAVLATREPGGTILGEQVREWLLSPKVTIPIASVTELCLFLAARAQHLEEKIIPALVNGQIVLCDRFNDSTIAYQGAGRGLGVNNVAQMCKLVCGAWQPTLTFYLDIDPTIGLERTKGASKESATGQLDKIESEAILFHNMIRDAFLQIAKQEPQRVQVIDAHQDAATVFQQVLAQILEKLS